MKTLATELACESSVIAFGAAASDGKCVLTIKVSENLVHRYGLHAGTMVRGLAQRYLSGGGGGQPTFGTAGGVNAAGIAEALQEVETVIKDLCKD
jgi:alanyl-tRNA synthetase